MKRLLALLLVPALAGAAPGDAKSAVQKQAVAQAGGPGEEGPPPSPAPQESPPAPPATPPAPPAQSQPAPAPSASGQWVYTQQYGWLWMPYGDAYAYVPPDGYGQPYMYVYYPYYAGWTWVVAPWVWGWGPWPFFGVHGPYHYAWYHQGWWRYPWHWHYVAPLNASRAGFRAGHPFAPAPVHGLVGSPAFRGGFAAMGAGAHVAAPAGRPGGGHAAGGHGGHR